MTRKTPMEARREKVTARVLSLLASSGRALIIDEMKRSLRMRRQNILESLHVLLQTNVIARSGSGRSGEPFYYMLVRDFSHLNDPHTDRDNNDKKIMEEFIV